LKLSIVVPILNEFDSLGTLKSQLEELRNHLEPLGLDLEIILNDNVSSDGSTIILSDWASREQSVVHDLFEKRLTFQQSIIRGFRSATGDCVVVFQGDLQDPWSIVVEFAKEWISGSRVVVGVSSNKHSNPLQSIFRKVFYAILKAGTAKRTLVGFQDFYLLDKAVYKAIASKPNHFQFIRGAIARDYVVDKVIQYQRNFRDSGKSKFRLGDRYDLALDALLIHNQGFTRKLSISGIVISILSLIFLLVLSVLWLLRVDFGVPGWLSTVGLLSFVIGIFSFVTAIQLEYQRRILIILTESSEV
jgi:glycosyltransferase involved in cell wall biosynthesis